jgi:gliding motility-associated lipoprotein GldD
MKMKINSLIVVVLMLVLSSCGQEESYDYYPKPISGHRIVFPVKEYKSISADCNYSFDIPKYSELILDTIKNTCNGNLVLNQFNATLFLTYIKIDTNLMYNIEYSRKLAYDHSIKADAIEEKVVLNSDNDTYGVQYKIVGNAASNYQFYVTDSSDNFLRGALYFNAAPNYDSIKPTLNFIMEDFDHLIETIDWK